MTGKIIVVEGYDGTGKTTLAKRLAETNDGIFYPNPKGFSDFTHDMYTLMKRYCDIDQDAKTMMFIANHIINIKDMNALKDSGKSVICDRSILSTLAYQFMSLETLTAILTACKVPSLNYDKVIVLTACTEAITSRIEDRGSDSLDQYFISNLEKIRSCYHTHTYDIYPNEKCVMIDTSNLRPEEVFEYSNWYINIE